MEICSYAGTGNVLKVQALLRECTEHIVKDPDAEEVEGAEKKETEGDLHQQISVLGIALISMGEDVGAEMSLRTFSHLVSLLSINFFFERHS